jgi:CheY-like chemotaxis protein
MSDGRESDLGDDAVARARASVLVVDDDEVLRDLLADFLERCGFEVTQAGSADEAFALFQLRPPTLVISDINMPGRDGTWLVSAIRALPRERGGATPVIALSSDPDWEHAMPSGFDVHVLKPIHPTRLLQVVIPLVRHETSTPVMP